MQFNHDNLIGARLAASLVDVHVGGGWGRAAVADALESARVRLDGLDEALPALHAWVLRLHGLFATDDVPTRCRLIDGMLDDGVARVRLTTHDALPPHLHFFDEEDPLLDRVRALTVGGIALLAVDSGGERMGACARPGCRRVYIDTSRNGTRAYCSAQCGNRHAVQRYRDRRAVR